MCPEQVVCLQSKWEGETSAIFVGSDKDFLFDSLLCSFHPSFIEQTYSFVLLVVLSSIRVRYLVHTSCFFFIFCQKFGLDCASALYQWFTESNWVDIFLLLFNSRVRGCLSFPKFRSDADGICVLPELLVVRNVLEKRYKSDVFMSNFWCLWFMVLRLLCRFQSHVGASRCFVTAMYLICSLTQEWGDARVFQKLFAMMRWILRWYWICLELFVVRNVLEKDTN